MMSERYNIVRDIIKKNVTAYYEYSFKRKILLAFFIIFMLFFLVASIVALINSLVFFGNIITIASILIFILFIIIVIRLNKTESKEKMPEVLLSGMRDELEKVKIDSISSIEMLQNEILCMKNKRESEMRRFFRRISGVFSITLLIPCAFIIKEYLTINSIFKISEEVLIDEWISPIICIFIFCLSIVVLFSDLIDRIFSLESYDFALVSKYLTDIQYLYNNDVDADEKCKIAQ